LLEAARKRRPRGMVAHPRKRWTEPGLQTLWRLCEAISETLIAAAFGAHKRVQPRASED